MERSKDIKMRVAVVLAPLVLCLALPCALRINQDMYSGAALRFDHATVYAGMAIDIVAVIAFAAVFAVSLLAFVRQRQHRGLLITASALSLVFFMAFAFGYFLFAYDFMDGWFVCAYDQMAFGLVPVIGYGVAAFARS